MSSTHRGYDRHQSDYYVTPEAPIKEFLNAFLFDLGDDHKGRELSDRPDRAKWLDPCAGGDKEHPMAYPSVIQTAFEPNVLSTMDIREDSPAELIGDYLEREDTRGYDVIITNPPFYQAKEIIEKALLDVNGGGYVIMLLRLNFFGSAGRFEFWQQHPAFKVYVHHKRICFTDNGKTDSIEYAHFVWRKGFTGETTIKVI